LALAGLILPTLLTNGWQALRQGYKAALGSIRRFHRFMLAGLVALLISAQLVPYLSIQVMLLLIGVPVALFAAVGLTGWQWQIAQGQRRGLEPAIGAFAGFIGGLSGVWGPPTVVYLTALDTPKQEHVRVQGVIYGIGAVALFGAHLASGVVRAETLPFSLALIPPALLGMWLGLKVHDRIDQAAFRKATQAVLLIAGLNLVRRGLMG
jgi:hypothetical protein